MRTNVKVDVPYDVLTKALRVGVRKETGCPFARKTKFDGIEQYLYFLHDGQIAPYESSAEQMWEIARNNTFQSDDVCVFPMGNMVPFQLLSGSDEVDEKKEALNETMIVTNAARSYGAVHILNDSLMGPFTDGKHVMLPSSVHEVIILPVPEEYDHECFDSMVRDVNERCVDEEIQLSDRAYLLC